MFTCVPPPVFRVSAVLRCLILIYYSALRAGECEGESETSRACARAFGRKCEKWIVVSEPR